MTATRGPYNHTTHTQPPSARIDWREDAACTGTDPEMWFSDNRHDLNRATAICATCTVQAECHQFANNQTHEVYGVWAGRDRNPEHARRVRHPLADEDNWPSYQTIVQARRRYLKGDRDVEAILGQRVYYRRMKRLAREQGQTT